MSLCFWETSSPIAVMLMEPGTFQKELLPVYYFLLLFSEPTKGLGWLFWEWIAEWGPKKFHISGFQTCRFPIWISFAMTINRAQGRSISGYLGINLSAECCSHGQLYVALSRRTSPRNVFVRTENKSKTVKNVVYTEISSSEFKPNSRTVQGLSQ